MMSAHQIIYTSCMRGINGVNDGQQVFSYDASFKDANNDGVKSLFSYQPPTLESGLTMTEEIARTLPRSFIYRRLDNGKCALALSSYLGRDYMGSAGRFGNYLSHVVVADENEIAHYPCEFFGGALLRDQMQFEEVNNPNKPDFLPVPILERGFTVDVGTVIEFLSVNDRLKIFKNMIYAVLSFDSQRKRLVICDDPQNIIMWIAAIEYTLPLSIAMSINFSTFDFDPSLSVSQICGVVPSGTRYTSESKRLHFVFDLYQNDCIEFELDEYYFDFIDASMSFSYESLQDFHRFIIEGYTYKKADENIYAAYRLYTLLSDNLAALPLKDIETALSFASKYAIEDEENRILNSILADKVFLMDASIQTFISIMRYTLTKYPEISKEKRICIRAYIVDKLLYEYVNNANDEQKFMSFYDEVDSLCSESGLSISTELMNESNFDKIVSSLRNNITSWQIALIVRQISKYIQEHKLPISALSIEASLGQLYYNVVKVVYSINAKKGSILTTCSLDAFSYDTNYLVNMALNLEGMLLDLPNGDHEVSLLWDYFCSCMVKNERSDFIKAYSLLGNYQRYDQIYLLYSYVMKNAKNITACIRVFNEHYNKYIIKDREYAQQYENQILEDYYLNIKSHNSELTYSAKVDLFKIIYSEKRVIIHGEELVEDIISTIPLELPMGEREKLVQTIFEYVHRYLNKPISGNLLLFAIAFLFEACKKSSHLDSVIESIDDLREHNRADMTNVQLRSAEKYFEWLLPKVCANCEETKDLEIVYDIFDMPFDISTLFFTTCVKIYMKQSKDDKNFVLLTEFLGFVFLKAGFEVRNKIGKELSKLSKQKFNDLDLVMRDLYSESKTALRYWDDIKASRENTNPILNNISNLFKRIKD